LGLLFNFEVQTIIYGFLETTGGVFLYQEEGPECPAFRLDQVYAWHQQDLYFYVPGGHYRHDSPAFFEETLRSGRGDGLTAGDGMSIDGR
jgi:hypothetical protein